MKSLSTTEMLLCAAEAGARFHGYDDKGKPVFSYEDFCLNEYNKEVQRKLKQKKDEEQRRLDKMEEEFWQFHNH